MTNDYKLIKTMLYRVVCHDTKEKHDKDKAIELADELIKRAEPMKPRFDKSNQSFYKWEYFCPNCETGELNYVRFPYCRWCGQRLDWSEE